MRTQVLVWEEFYIKEVRFFFLRRNIRQRRVLSKQHLLPPDNIP